MHHSKPDLLLAAPYYDVAAQFAKSSCQITLKSHCIITKDTHTHTLNNGVLSTLELESPPNKIPKTRMTRL